MQNVPHWQLLILLYFVLVAVPVILVHSWMKKKLLSAKTPLNLLLYFMAVTATAFIMHFFTMWMYFRFIFGSHS